MSAACSCTQYALQEPEGSPFFSSLGPYVVGAVDVLSAPLLGSLVSAVMADITVRAEVRNRASVCHNKAAR